MDLGLTSEVAEGGGAQARAERDALHKDATQHNTALGHSVRLMMMREWVGLWTCVCAQPLRYDMPWAVRWLGGGLARVSRPSAKAKSAFLRDRLAGWAGLA